MGKRVGPAGDDDLAPRCVKDSIEEALFERRRELFSELGLMFVDTTSLSVEGAGGEALGVHGYSKDHRPELKQMFLAAVIDGEGRPVWTEMAAGAKTTCLGHVKDASGSGRAMPTGPIWTRRTPDSSGRIANFWSGFQLRDSHTPFGIEI